VTLTLISNLIPHMTTIVTETLQ